MEANPGVALVPFTNLDPASLWATLESQFHVSLKSPHSRAAYTQALENFTTWTRENASGRQLSRSLVLEFRASMIKSKVASSTINLRLAAVRHLVREAEYLGLMTAIEGHAITAIRGVEMRGIRAGNWLTASDTDRFLSQPDRKTLKGVRDFAILALLFSCGLRRAELASLRVDQLAHREDRLVILDLSGKGNRLRTIPVPGIARDAIEAWQQRSQIRDGRLFRAINKASKVQGSGLTPEAILFVVKNYSVKLSKEIQQIPTIRPHDARRTYAKLCRKAGGSLEEIRDLLGHSSVSTTMRYLGDDQNIKVSVNDRLIFKPVQNDQAPSIHR